jgi:hypothetical protein
MTRQDYEVHKAWSNGFTTALIACSFVYGFVIYMIAR